MQVYFDFHFIISFINIKNNFQLSEKMWKL